MKHWLFFLAIFLIGMYFRTYSLLEFPPSLYWEEVALGYDSYSILKTGKDHHGNVMPLIAFESFGDWKPSLYFYYLVPFISVFGLTDLAVRIAAVFVGMLFLIGMPFLGKELRMRPWIVMAITAISPWAIHFSRSAWEAYLAATLILWSIIFLLKSFRTKKMMYMYLASVLFAFSMYAYHAARVIAPLIFGTIFLVSAPIQFRRITLANLIKVFSVYIKKYFFPVALFIFLIVPLILAVINNDVSITHRFQETNIFSDISIIEKSNDLKEISGNTILSRLFYHRYVLFGEEILKNIFSYFTINYLALSGDQNLRHSTGYTGVLYLFDVVFLLAGLYSFIKKSLRTSALLLIWLLITLLPAAVSIPNPHALRTVIAMPVYILLIAEGLNILWHYVIDLMRKFKQYLALQNKFFKLFNDRFIKTTLAVILICIYSVQVLAFWRYYSTIYARQTSADWQYGYAQLISYLKDVPSDTTVFVSRTLGRPAMYYWFYSQANPRVVQEQNDQVEKDQSEFLQFNNIGFFRGVGEVPIAENVVVALPNAELPSLIERTAQNGLVLQNLATIENLNNQPVWHVVKIIQ